MQVQATMFCRIVEATAPLSCPSLGPATTIIYGLVTQNGDQFDLRSLLATNWNGDSSTLGSLLKLPVIVAVRYFAWFPQVPFVAPPALRPPWKVRALSVSQLCWLTPSPTEERSHR